jgi:hypothetical protein
MVANFSAESKMLAARLVGGQSWLNEVSRLPHDDGTSPASSGTLLTLAAARK